MYLSAQEPGCGLYVTLCAVTWLWPLCIFLYRNLVYEEWECKTIERYKIEDEVSYLHLSNGATMLYGILGS